MKTPRITLSLVAALALLLVWAAAPAGRASSRAASVASVGRRRPPASHVVVIMLENKEYGQVVGSRKAPFLNAFARRNVLLTHTFAVSHPSEPNYLALTSGRTLGVRNDCGRCTYRLFNIADQVTRNRMGWKAYMQGMPSPCFKGSRAGRFPHLYASKHDPFILYADIRSSPARCHRIVPFSQLRPDLGNGRLPRFAFISPDECNDMHSCSVGTGDAWLGTWIPRIVPKLGSNGLLILVFDEGSTSLGCCSPAIHGGRVAAVIAGPGAADGVRIAHRADHYSILRLIDDALGFRRIGHARDRSTPSILGWRAP